MSSTSITAATFTISRTPDRARSSPMVLPCRPVDGDISQSQTKSQRKPAPGDAGPLPAIIAQVTATPGHAERRLAAERTRLTNEGRRFETCCAHLLSAVNPSISFTRSMVYPALECAKGANLGAIGCCFLSSSGHIPRHPDAERTRREARGQPGLLSALRPEPGRWLPDRRRGQKARLRARSCLNAGGRGWTRSAGCCWRPESVVLRRFPRQVIGGASGTRIAACWQCKLVSAGRRAGRGAAAAGWLGSSARRGRWP
jgi:hypothetical protein